MTHYYVTFDYPKECLANLPPMVQFALTRLNGKYEVVEALGTSKLCGLDVCFASIRKGVDKPFAGCTYRNPTDAPHACVGKKIAFKRAVKALLSSWSEVIQNPKDLDILIKIGESEFRRLRSINEVILEETHD
jgi:hypothetical protein